METAIFELFEVGSTWSFNNLFGIMLQNSFEIKEIETDEKDETNFSVNSFQFIDCYQLYNKLQLTPCTITIDLQSKEDYVKSHIKHSLNIDKSDPDYDSSKLFDIISKYQNEQCKSTITSIYFYSNHNIGYFNLIKSIRDVLLKNNVLNKDDTLYTLQDNYSVILNKFPFLCESPAAADDEKESSSTNTNTSGSKSVSGSVNKLKQRRYFMAQNKGIYPNQIVNDKLYLGDKNGALSEKVLKDLKITHIINCTPKPPDHIEKFTSRGYIKNYFEDNKEMNIKYMRVAIDDSFLQNIKTHFENAIGFINSALSENDGMNNNRVYIHCFAGISRSSTITIAYLMSSRKMGYDEAYQFVKERREVIKPNEGFTEQLQKYEKELAL